MSLSREELEQKINPSKANPDVFFKEVANEAEALELVDKALEAEIGMVRESRKKFMNVIIGIAVAATGLVVLRYRTGEGILKLVITILAAALVLIILNLFSQVRSYRRIIQDEEDTRRRLAEGSINAMDFLKQYRDFKLEGIQKAGLTEEFARYEEIYRQEHA